MKQICIFCFVVGFCINLCLLKAYDGFCAVEIPAFWIKVHVFGFSELMEFLGK